MVVAAPSVRKIALSAPTGAVAGRRSRRYRPRGRVRAVGIVRLGAGERGIEDADQVDIGERLEVLKDYPTSPGCTSPFAPIWINEMVRRQ